MGKQATHAKPPEVVANSNHKHLPAMRKTRRHLQADAPRNGRKARGEPGFSRSKDGWGYVREQRFSIHFDEQKIRINRVFFELSISRASKKRLPESCQGCHAGDAKTHRMDMQNIQNNQNHQLNWWFALAL